MVSAGENVSRTPTQLKNDKRAHTLLQSEFFLKSDPDELLEWSFGQKLTLEFTFGYQLLPGSRDDPSRPDSREKSKGQGFRQLRSTWVRSWRHWSGSGIVRVVLFFLTTIFIS